MKVRVAEEVLSRTVEGETVLLDLKSGTYFGLKGVGTPIWDLIKDNVTKEKIVVAITERFDVDAATASCDLDRLLGELSARGLVRFE